MLLVDDQRLVGEAVRRMLSGESNIQYHFCDDPAQALARAVELKPTVILQDLVMPDVDGLDLVRAYREEPRTRTVPLIVLSMNELPEVKVEAFGAGANDYLVKLPHRLELVARIRHHSAGYTAQLQRDEAFRQVERRNTFIREAFGRYVSDAVVESLLDSPEGPKLGGEARDVSILMADLRGFTALTERLAAAQVVQLLNNFLGTMIDVILAAGGIVDELIGDAILAIFNAPLQLDRHCERAVMCAVAMQGAMERVNTANVQAGLPPVQMGIGVHTGEVITGSIGSLKRAKYSVIGSPVNMTARVESFTLGGQVLISNAASAAGGPVELGDSFEIMAKGFHEPIVVHDVLGMGPPWNVKVPQREDIARPLLEPVPVDYRVLSNKVAEGPTASGFIVALSSVEAEIEGDELVPVLSDVKLTIHDPEGLRSDFYGKVVSRKPHRRVFALRFTSLPPEVEAVLMAIRASTMNKGASL